MAAKRVLNADYRSEKHRGVHRRRWREITLGPVGPVECAATAADRHNAVAMLVRREGETLNALLKRLDKAIARFYANDEITDEINGL